MAVYDSGITSDLDSIRTAIDDELPAKMTHVRNIGAVTSASTTPVTLQTISLTGVVADEVILILALAEFSSSVTTDSISVGIFIDGVSVAGYVPLTSRQTITIPFLAENKSGTVTVTFEFFRAAGSGTVTVHRHSVDTLRFKKR